MLDSRAHRSQPRRGLAKLPRVSPSQLLAQPGLEPRCLDTQAPPSLDKHRRSTAQLGKVLLKTHLLLLIFLWWLATPQH